MFKLLLTSSGTYITDGQYEIFDKPRNQVRWAYITTAGKSVPDVSYMEVRRQRMQELHWDFQEMDIAGKTEDELNRLLHDKEAIYLEGGNTFYLLKAIRESGFEKILRRLLKKGAVYIGASAGAYVACPTIEAATWKGNNKFDRHGLADFTAMNLVPFLIFAHTTPGLKALVQAKADRAKYPVRFLTDQQAILVKGDTIETLNDDSIKSK